MKKTMRRYWYCICFVWLLSCHDRDTPHPEAGSVADHPEARKAFFTSTATDQLWKISRLTFAKPTLVPELSEDPYTVDSTLITDLYAVLTDCRKDDKYTFRYQYGDVSIDFNNQYGREEEGCHPQEPAWIEEGIYLAFNDSITVAKATFRNNDAVRQFFGFNSSHAGTGYLGYEMVWEIKSLSADSINISGIFTKRRFPELSIQFIPVK